MEKRKTGLYDPQGNFHELSLYEIQGLCTELVKKAIADNALLREEFENEYQAKIHFFSKEVEFCLHRLGWMIYDPFCSGKDEVLVADGKKAFLVAESRLKDVNFDRHKLDNQNRGYPILTDAVVGYDPKMSVTNLQSGFITEKGYVDAKFVANKNLLALLIGFNKMISSQTEYENYLAHRDEYASPTDYLANQKNCIAVEKSQNGKLRLHYAQDNEGMVADFVNLLNQLNMLDDLDVVVEPEKSVMRIN